MQNNDDNDNLSLDQWFDEQSDNDSVHFSFTKEIYVEDLVEDDIKELAAAEAEDIAGGECREVRAFIEKNLFWEMRDFYLMLEIEICVVRDSSGKYSAFVNRVKAD